MHWLRVLLGLFVAASGFVAMAPLLHADEESGLSIFVPAEENHILPGNPGLISGYSRGLRGELLRGALLDKKLLDQLRHRDSLVVEVKVPRGETVPVTLVKECECVPGARTFSAHVVGKRPFKLYVSIARALDDRDQVIEAVSSVMIMPGLVDEWVPTIHDLGLNRGTLYLKRSLDTSRGAEDRQWSRFERVRPNSKRARELGIAPRADARMPMRTPSRRRSTPVRRREEPPAPPQPGALPRLEILVGYTTTVLDEAGSLAAIVTRTGNAVCILKDILRAAGAPAEVCVTRFFHVKMYEGTMSDDHLLTTFLGADRSGTPRPTDYSAKLKELRKQDAADIVTVLVGQTKQGDPGEAEIWTKGATDFYKRAYNIVNWWELNSGHALAHEIGHNLGCRHRPPKKGEKDDALAEFAFGHVYTWSKVIGRLPNGDLEVITKNYCTIMGDPNVDVIFSSTCAPIVGFSNPRRLHPEDDDGLPMGVQGVSDNARLLQCTIKAAARWGERFVRRP